MEDTLISIDSKYRNFSTYSNESKFTFTPEKIYKNVVSVKMVSLELTNTINYISSSKNNNYFTSVNLLMQIHSKSNSSQIRINTFTYTDSIISIKKTS